MYPANIDAKLRILSAQDWLSLDLAYRRAFYFLLALNILAFGPFFLYPIYTPDDIAELLPTGLILHRVFPTDRPVADMIFPFLSSGAQAPFLQGTISIVANALSAVLLCAHWNVRRTLDIVLVGGLITTCPAWADLYSFIIASVRLQTLAFPMAIFAYLLALRSSLVYRILAFGIMSFSVGLYQLSVNYYVMLVVIDFAILSLFARTEDAWRYIKTNLAPAISVFLLASVAFVGYAQLMSPNEFSRVDLALTPIGSIADILDKFAMYRRIGDALFNGIFVGLFAYGSVVISSLVFVGTFAALMHLGGRYTALEATARALVFVALGVALFLAISAAQSFNIYNPIFLRVLVSSGLFFSLFLVIAVHAEYVRGWGRKLAVVASSIVLFMFISTDEYIHSIGIVADRADLAIATRMALQIESQNSTDQPLPLVVIGISHSFLGLKHLEPENAISVAARPWFDAPVSSFRAPWAKRPIFHAVGHEFLLPSEEQISRACALSHSMPVWPADGSVLVREGVSVIKLGPPLERDYCDRTP